MRIIPILLLLVAACSKDEAKKDEAPAPGKPGSTETPSTTKPSTAPPPPSGMGKVTCDEGLPEPARGTHFPGYTLEEKYHAQSGTTECNFSKEGDFQGVLIVCPGWGEATFAESMKYARESMEGKDLAVGKHGFAAEKHGMQIVQFQDDDAPCYVTITGKSAGEALGKDLATNITAANATP